jgi:circadian clock protein KaiB
MSNGPRKTDPAEQPVGTGDPQYVLRLYVTGSTPRSMRAIENIRRICAADLEGRYELAVIDIYQNPEAAREQQIIAAPTLLRVVPTPLRRIIGDLSDRDKVLAGLDVRPKLASQD